MDKNEEMICDDCGKTFQSSIEVQSPIKHCPKCVEKSQETMLGIMFWIGWNPVFKNDDDENISMTTICSPSNNFGLYALLDKVLNKVVVVISESPEGAYYRRNGNWVDVSDEDYQGEFDNAMVIDVDPTFVAIYDEAESSSNTFGVDRVKEYMAKNID